MSIFGSSYPPGCSGVPDDDAPEVSPQADQVADILNKAELEPVIVDEVCEIVDSLAHKVRWLENKECPRCVDAMMSDIATNSHIATAIPAPGPNLIPEELTVLGLTANLWNAYKGLPGQHNPDDLLAVRHALHLIQGIVAVRVAKRVDPEVWS